MEWTIRKASNPSPIYASPFSTTQVTLHYRITSEFRKTAGWYCCYYYNLKHQAARMCISKKSNRGNGKRRVHPRVPCLYEPHMHIYSHPHRHTSSRAQYGCQNSHDEHLRSNIRTKLHNEERHTSTLHLPLWQWLYQGQNGRDRNKRNEQDRASWV